MRVEEAIEEINKAFEPAFANYIITALTEGTTVSDRALEQEPKTGHWINLKDIYGDIVESVCSNCDHNGNYKWKYCPNCGAKMVYPQERSDKE